MAKATSTSSRFPIPEWAVADLLERGVIDTTDVVHPMVITPAPSDDRKSKHYVEGAFFDVDEVARVCRVLSAQKHIKGRWRGKPLKPAAWQVLFIIAPVFGWRTVNESGRSVRIIRDVWIEIPRKNGKSTLASGLAIVLLVADREPGAEVYAAAGSKEQAGQVFEPAKAMVQSSTRLRGKIKTLTSVLRVPATGSIFRVLSKLADVAHGLNVSGAVIDEVHVHKSRDLIDAIETGTGAREQPLVIFITTADDGKRTTIYAEKRQAIEDLADDRGDSAVESFGLIWAAPEGEDPFIAETIAKANPNMGISVTMADTLRQARKAQVRPSFMPTYERLYLNRRRADVARAINMVRWDRSGEPAFTLPEIRKRMRDRECYGGLDLSTTEDFTAWALVFPEQFEFEGEPEPVEGLVVIPRLWIPRAAVERRKAMRSTLEVWAEAGWITITEGDVVDYEVIEAGIGADAEAFNIKEFSYDPWQAENLRQRLTSGGLVGWKCGQTMANLSGPTAELERLYLLEVLWHGGNPALAWMASNVVARPDRNGRWKPERDLSAEKIDGIAAVIGGIAAQIRERDAALPAPASAKAAGAENTDLYRPSGRLDI
jgi:phage terminase large subunit-like protein